MGPVRGRLTTAAMTLLPGPALAEVCASLRPGWIADGGPVGAGAEAIYILSSFPGLVVLAFLAFGLARPNLWISTACALPAFGLAGLLGITRRADSAAAAIAEGCIGPVWPVVLLLVALGGVTLVRGWRRG